MPDPSSIILHIFQQERFCTQAFGSPRTFFWSRLPDLWLAIRLLNSSFAFFWTVRLRDTGTQSDQSPSSREPQKTILKFRTHSKSFSAVLKHPGIHQTFYVCNGKSLFFLMRHSFSTYPVQYCLQSELSLQFLKPGDEQAKLEWCPYRPDYTTKSHHIRDNKKQTIA